jgi:16S rRNA G966 N2-methylase RsmD
MDIGTYPNIIIYDILEKYINNNKNYHKDKFDYSLSLINVNNLSNSKIIFKNNQIEQSQKYNCDLEIKINDNKDDEEYMDKYSKAIIEYNNYFNSMHDNKQINDNAQNISKHLKTESETLNSEILNLETLNLETLNSEIVHEIVHEMTNSESCDNILSKLNISDDPWESSINDDKFYISNKVARIFPVLKHFNNFSKIKIDDESFCYITIREIADIMSKIICHHLLEYNLNPQKSKIVDYTSGVGGNVLSFSKYFKYIYAIELSSKRAEYLQNNIDVYGFKNIQVINSCAIEFNNNELITVNPSVIFIDPPWGGANYKNSDSLILNLGPMTIEDLIFDIATKFSNHYKQIIKLNPKEKINNLNNKFIVLKLPKNYDIEYLYNFINSKNNFQNYNISIFLYILNKMLIVVCELQFKYYLQT